jgi:3-oxoacyl-[acyl-carrier protein] reductase
MSLQGKVALVTGASRGIGQAIALELGRQGAIVVGTATSASGAERIAATLKENGIQGTGLELNVTSDESVAACWRAFRSSSARRRFWSTMPASPATT